MATATLARIGSTQKFDVMCPEASIPPNLTLKREHPQIADSWNSYLPAVPKPHYDYLNLASAFYDVARNASAWYRPSTEPDCGAGQAKNLEGNDWGFLSSELERIANLGNNWDGEAAEAISAESVDTARSLIKIAQDAARKVVDQGESFMWLLRTACGPDLRLSSTVDRSTAPTRPKTSEPDPSSAIGLFGVACDSIRTGISNVRAPGLYPTADGGVTLKWIHRGRELQCTAMGKTVEVIRWESVDLYDSEGLWDLNVEQTREHFEWLMR